MHADKTITVRDICKTLRISRPTLCRYLARTWTGPSAHLSQA